MFKYDNYEICPYCGSRAYADWVDCDVTWYQCSPYYCEKCGASEIGFHCDDLGGLKKQLKIFYSRELDLYGRIINRFVVAPETSRITQEEFDKGWYKPKSKLANTVNTYNGKLVSCEVAEELYKLGLLDIK